MNSHYIIISNSFRCGTLTSSSKDSPPLSAATHCIVLFRIILTRTVLHTNSTILDSNIQCEIALIRAGDKLDISKALVIYTACCLTHTDHSHVLNSDGNRAKIIELCTRPNTHYRC